MPRRPQSETNNPAQLVDRRGLAKLLQRSPWTIGAWLRCGKLPQPFRLGNKDTWRVIDITAWIEAEMAKPRPLLPRQGFLRPKPKMPRIRFKGKTDAEIDASIKAFEAWERSHAQAHAALINSTSSDCIVR